MTTIEARGILFDMDGTLVDSHAVVERMWTSFAVRFGIDPGFLLANSHGIRMRDTLARFAPPGADLAALHAEFEGIELTDVGGLAAVPGAAELLAELPANRVALVTSATPHLARFRMEAVGVPIPAVMVDSTMVAHGKPHPDPYLRGAELLGLPASATVVFEDADAGIRSALDAGARVVVVGAHRSPLTEGLPRIADYRGVRVAVRDGLVELELPESLG